MITIIPKNCFEEAFIFPEMKESKNKVNTMFRLKNAAVIATLSEFKKAYCIAI